MVDTFDFDNERLDTDIQASDVLSVPEGTKEFVDLIGDEKLDSFGNPSSNLDQQTI